MNRNDWERARPPSWRACRAGMPSWPFRLQLAARVIPPVPVRQCVISVPKRRRSHRRLRGVFADRPTAVTALTRIFLDEIERFLGDAVGLVPDASARPSLRPRLGAVSFLHRFGSALNHHVHLHACVTDGLFAFAIERLSLHAGHDGSPERIHIHAALTQARYMGRPRPEAQGHRLRAARRLRAESPAQTRRHGAGHRQSWQAGRRSIPCCSGREPGQGWWRCMTTTTRSRWHPTTCR